MALNVKKYKVRLILTERMLGTVPKNDKIFTGFVLQKAKEAMEKDAKKGYPAASGEERTEEQIQMTMAEEESTVAQLEEKGWTGFHTDAKGTFIYDYLLRGFLKHSAGVMSQWTPDDDTPIDPSDEEPEEEVEEEKPKGKAKKPKKVDRTIKQLKDKVSNTVFILPRRIYVPVEDDVLERPLRAQTQQGPRVALARSDTVAADTVLEFEMHVLMKAGKRLPKECIADMFEYGIYQGLGQWRSGGYGTFVVDMFEEIEDKPKPKKEKPAKK